MEKDTYWNKTIKRAKKYEHKFVDLFKKKSNKEIKHMGGLDEPDFIIGQHIAELKSDFHQNSPNLFIETIANERKQSVGGPYQSSKYGTKWFLTWFPLDQGDNLYVFDNDELCKWLDDNKHRYYKHRVENKEYYTIGRIIPKADLIQLPFCKVKSL